MERDLDGQVAIVTGAAHGIGLGIAGRLAELGARVVCWDIASPAADGGLFAHAESVDVADPDSVSAALERTLAAMEQVDILVNNAGVNGPTVPIQDYAIADWHKVIVVDLTGVFLCCKALVPHMVGRGYGRIARCTTQLLRGRESDLLNDSILQMELSNEASSSRHSLGHAIAPSRSGQVAT